METFTRRGFIGTTAGVVGAATVAQASGIAAAAEPTGSGLPAKKTGMRVGMLTSPFGGETLETVAEFARQAGIASLEIAVDPGSTQLDPTTLDTARAEAILKLMDEKGLSISALANYDDMTEPGKTEEHQAFVNKMIDAAALLGIKVICLQTGSAAPNMNKINTIKKVLPKVFAPIIAYAKEKGINIAIENYFRTCLQGIDTFECLFETITDDNFGLNYDPSHLYHQQCSHLLPVTMFAKRIFHVHAKDTLVDTESRARMGVYADGWWRYVIPGCGNINWGEFISHLRMNGYDDVLSIEHEDYTFTREQGFIVAARHLNQFC